MPPVEAADPALVLDEYFNRTQNFPEELRFVQEEIAEKDRQYKELIQEIEDRDGRIQKWIKAHGSHHLNPKEEEYRTTIRKNYAQAEQLSNEKIALTQKLLHNMDKHTRQLDMQIKMLYDRGEPGFTDPDELPSLIRSSAANITTGGPRGANGTTAATSALNNLTNSTQVRASNAQVRHAQAQQHGSASAPATPAASMIMNRQARESSAGPATKRLPRSNSGLGTLPATSSGLARHSSLGPGTPKGHQTAPGVQRAGSAGPRATSKGSLAGGSRKAGTPSSTSGRKKGTPAAGGAISKSGLSRVKRAAKNSPSSAAESELSDADSASDSASDTRTGGRGTPVTSSFSRSASNQAALPTPAGVREASNPHRRTPSGASAAAASHHPHHGGSRNGEGGGGGGGERQHGTRPSPHPRGGGGGGGGGGARDDDDLMDIDDDEAGDDRKYCSCQNVSFGNMVACDNDQCPYEWFHWGCVGLKSEPNGTWYCPECSEKLRKR